MSFTKFPYSLCAALALGSLMLSGSLLAHCSKDLDTIASEVAPEPTDDEMTGSTRPLEKTATRWEGSLEDLADKDHLSEAGFSLTTEDLRSLAMNESEADEPRMLALNVLARRDFDGNSPFFAEFLGKPDPVSRRAARIWKLKVPPEAFDEEEKRRSLIREHPPTPSTGQLALERLRSENLETDTESLTELARDATQIPLLRNDALRVLAERDLEANAELFRELLPDQDVQRAAAYALAVYGNPSDIAVVTQAMHDAQTLSDQIWLGDILAIVKVPSGVPYFIKGLEMGGPNDRYFSIRALGRLLKAGVLPAEIDIRSIALSSLEDERQNVRSESLRILERLIEGGMEDARLLPVLAKAADNDPSSSNRFRAARLYRTLRERAGEEQ